MGKKCIKEDKNPKVNDEGSGITRREFLQGAGALGSLSLLRALGLVSLLPTIYRDTKVDEWSFLEREIFTPDLGLKEIIDSYIPLDPQVITPLVIESTREKVAELILDEINIRGYEPSAKYSIDTTLQNYGVPTKKERAESALKYCKKALLFLEDRIKGVHPIDIRWTIIDDSTKQNNYSNDSNKRAYICKSFYNIYRTRVTNESDSSQSFLVANHSLIAGGMVIKHVDNLTKKLSDWRVILAANRNLIRDVFSEFLPLYITEPIDKIGYDQTHTLVETVSEAMAHHLALESVKSFNIPRGYEIVTETTGSLIRDPMYDKVPKAIEWIQKQGKQGLQNAYDLLREDPRKLIEILEINA